ncbi:MAG: hypothetical protein LBD13_08260 [Spirochaetaceae bacterium]|jgi:hypothetical protein|nr:hypothetical protein [Spirochaetaceae bacterium]
MGHRDSIPENPNEFKAWSKNFVAQVEKNRERWNIPKEFADGLTEAFLAIEPDELCEEEPPSEPSPFNGYTIYWDDDRRFWQIYCEYRGIPFNADLGAFDKELLLEKEMEQHTSQEERLNSWKAYLMERVRKTAETYQMPPSWVEEVQERMNKPAPKASGEGKGSEAAENVRNLFFTFYRL